MEGDRTKRKPSPRIGFLVWISRPDFPPLLPAISRSDSPNIRSIFPVQIAQRFHKFPCPKIPRFFRLILAQWQGWPRLKSAGEFPTTTPIGWSSLLCCVKKFLCLVSNGLAPLQSPPSYNPTKQSFKPSSKTINEVIAVIEVVVTIGPHISKRNLHCIGYLSPVIESFHSIYQFSGEANKINTSASIWILPSHQAVPASHPNPDIQFKTSKPRHPNLVIQLYI